MLAAVNDVDVAAGRLAQRQHGLVTRAQLRSLGMTDRHGLPEPVRQHRVALPSGRVARIDLAYPEIRLGIEADGRIWHSGKADFERDRTRANVLAASGWTVLRFGWADVRDGRLAGEVAAVRQKLLAHAV